MCIEVGDDKQFGSALAPESMLRKGMDVREMSRTGTHQLHVWFGKPPRCVSTFVSPFLSSRFYTDSLIRNYGNGETETITFNEGNGEEARKMFCLP